MVTSYSRPKGLHARKRVVVLSESEREDLQRYSKENVQTKIMEKSLHLDSRKGFLGANLSRTRISFPRNEG